MREFDWGEFILISLGGIAAGAVALAALRAIAGPPPYSIGVGLLAIVIGVAPFLISRWRRRKS